MKILYDIDSDGATVTASTQNDNFPAANVQTRHTNEVWRSTAATSQYLDIDMGTATSIDSCGIISGEEQFKNISGRLSSSATIVLYGSATGAFAGEEVTVNTFTATGERIIFETFTAGSYRYFRLSLSDATLTDIRVGRVALGSYYAAPGIRPNPKISFQDTSFNQLSVGGQSYGAEGYEFREFDVSMPKVIIAEKNNLIELYKTVLKFRPFFVDLFDCKNLDPPNYVVIDQNGFTFTYNTANIFTIGIKLLEVY